MRAALSDIETLLLVSASESEDRIARHLSAVDAAVAAGVRRIVYISFVGAAAEATFTLARHHWRTEQHIRSTGIAFTFLRDNLYQDVLPYFVGADGVIRGPAGNGRVGFVARDDIADVAVAVLLDGSGESDGQTYDLTGPQALTLHEVAAALSRASGREVSYHAGDAGRGVPVTASSTAHPIGWSRAGSRRTWPRPPASSTSSPTMSTGWPDIRRRPSRSFSSGTPLWWSTIRTLGRS